MTSHDDETELTAWLLADDDNQPEPMSPEDAARWASARTLADLGELTAQFLEGHLAQSPNHLASPDSETTPLIPLLAAVNRAGFMTCQSQPGVPVDIHGSEQRANVSGFTGDHAFARLMNAAANADLIITAARAADEDGGPIYCITRDCGEEFTWNGGAQAASGVRDCYSRTCHPDAVDALCRAWQVTLIDPQWGRDDHLWPVLEAFTRGA